MEEEQKHNFWWYVMAFLSCDTLSIMENSWKEEPNNLNGGMPLLEMLKECNKTNEVLEYTKGAHKVLEELIQELKNYINTYLDDKENMNKLVCSMTEDHIKEKYLMMDPPKTVKKKTILKLLTTLKDHVSSLQTVDAKTLSEGERILRDTVYKATLTELGENLTRLIKRLETFNKRTLQRVSLRDQVVYALKQYSPLVSGG